MDDDWKNEISDVDKLAKRQRAANYSNSPNQKPSNADDKSTGGSFSSADYSNKQIIVTTQSNRNSKHQNTTRYISLDDASYVDKKIAQNLRKGEIRYRDTLDLHGLKSDDAFSSLCSFIENSYNANLRCVLVITGKSKKSDDSFHIRLKDAVPHWLNSPAINNKILMFCHATPKNGSDGALYIYLKKYSY